MRRTLAALVAGVALVAAGCATGGGGGGGGAAPLAIFSPSISSGPAPLSVTFDASASNDPDGTIVSYSWDFGDFTTGSGVNPSHTFGAGSYAVTLTVTDNSGYHGASSTVISVSGAPIAPTGLALVGAGCCDTYADWSWNQVPGAAEYQISMDGYLGGGCLTDHSANIAAPASTGRVQAFGLCLGSHYNSKIRARVGPTWGPWSPTINVVL